MSYRKRSLWRSLLAVVLTLALVLPMSVVPVMGAEESDVIVVPLNNDPVTESGLTLEVTGDPGSDIVSLTDTGEFEVILTMSGDMLDDIVEESGLRLTAWLQSLEWALTRDDSDAPMDRDLIPYVYTGDKLENWQRWVGGDFFTDIKWYMEVSPVRMMAMGFGQEDLTVNFNPADVGEDGVNENKVDPEEPGDEDKSTDGEGPAITDPDEGTDGSDGDGGGDEIDESKDDEDSDTGSESNEGSDDSSEGGDESDAAGNEAEPETEVKGYLEDADDDEEIEVADDENTADDLEGTIPEEEDDEDGEEANGDEADSVRVESAAITVDSDSLIRPSSDVADGSVKIILTFKNNYFFNSGNISGNRNVQNSFIGEYALSVSDPSGIIAETSMYVNKYPSYRIFSEIRDELDEIMEAAAENGRYMYVESYGETANGYDQYYVVLARDEDAVDAFKANKEIAETDPEVLMEKVSSGDFDYQVPFHINNIHPDEEPGVDAQLNFLWKMATEETIPYSVLTDLTPDGEAAFLTNSSRYQYVTPVIEKWATKLGRLGSGQGTLVVEEMYEMDDRELVVDEILNDIIFIVTPNENPEGRILNLRRNINRFDLNRDGSFQTQAETINMMQLINEWNPVVLAELHGFVGNFLIEPCTPPHEPNLEYDILIEYFYKGGEAFGNAAIASLSDKYYNANGTNTYSKYVIPLRDYFVNGTWSAWDDLSTNYTPSYAMLNSNTMGYTIETPYSNEGSTDLFEFGMYGLVDFVAENKDGIYLNQLEFFRRGIENEDEEIIRSYYVDANDKPLDDPYVWRGRYEENDSYFPEYYVIPVDAEAQRDPAAAYEMEEFLLRNSIKLERLTEDTAVGDTVYKAGSIVVNMHQAKRNYANAVLWDGVDASMFTGLYSESVVSFPHLRGFDCIPVAVIGAFDGATEAVTEPSADASSQLVGSGVGVVLMNNGVEVIRAVNAMLANDVKVGLITNGQYEGNFLVSYADYAEIADDYVLVGLGINSIPEAYVINEPSIFITGNAAPFYNSKVASGYYSEWFSEGYGYHSYYNNYSNTTSPFDDFAYGEQMNFKLADHPSDADVIVSSISYSVGQYDAEALAQIQAGKPLVAHGQDVTRTVVNSLLSQYGFASRRDSASAESLFYVDYEDDSVITAARKSMGDNIVYGVGGSYVTSLPEGAKVLMRVAEEDFHIAGCYPGVWSSLGGKVVAFEYDLNGLDLTVFTNSIVNKAHQQDDYGYAATAIYSKTLSDELMEIDGASTNPFFKNVTGKGQDKISMSDNRTFEVTVPVEGATEEEVQALIDAGLTWYLQRDEGMMDDYIFPYQYLGGKLEDWRVWNTSNPAFTIQSTEVIESGGGYAIQMVLYSSRLMNSSGVNGSRNVVLNFTGYFDLICESAEGEILASGPVRVNPYDSYRTAMEVEIEIEAAAEYISGRDDMYAEVHTLGETYMGYNMPYIIIAKDKATMERYQELQEKAQETGTLTDAEFAEIAVPILYSNIHADETNGVDGVMNFMWDLAKSDQSDHTISYKYLEDFNDAGRARLELEKNAANIKWSELVEPYVTGVGFINGSTTSTNSGAVASFNQEDYYEISTRDLDVNDLLEDVFFILVPSENQDGRTKNTRANGNGYDLNRDNLFQTQPETQNMTKMIAEWTPITFIELHGFVSNFQVEPCTPPHEPNFEYDLVWPLGIPAGEAFGIAAVANNDTYKSYGMPARDYLVNNRWRSSDSNPWDDMSGNYTPQYSMLHGTVAYTIEIPASNEDGTIALEYGLIGHAAHVAENKDAFIRSQVEFFRRGLENEDAPEIRQYYVTQTDEIGAEADVFRPKYEATQNFFPECYIIPMGEGQRSASAVYDMLDYLLRNQVKVHELTADIEIDGTVYRAGSYVVSMYQARRNMGNSVLNDGVLIADWSGLYSEPITAFPHMRGFDCDAIAIPNIMSDVVNANLELVAEVVRNSEFDGFEGTTVVLFNNGLDSTNAVNELLAAGAEVGMVTEGRYKGHFAMTADTYRQVNSKYALVAEGTVENITAKAIAKPTVYVAGRPTSEFSSNSTYGPYGARSYSMGSTYRYDLNAIEMMGFEITTNLDEANAIIGNTTLTEAERNRVLDGMTYVASGYGASSTLSAILPAGYASSTVSNGDDALAYINYVGDSLVTDSYKYAGNETMYSYGGRVVASVPEGANVLIRIDAEKDLIAGFFRRANQASYKGRIAAFEYKQDGLDVTAFGGTIFHKSHAQGDFIYASNAIFSGLMGEEMDLTVNNVIRYTADEKAKAVVEGSSVDVTSTLSIINPANLNGLVMDFEYDAEEFEFIDHEGLTDELPIFEIKVENGKGRVIFMLPGEGRRLNADGEVELLNLQFRSADGARPDESVVKATSFSLQNGSLDLDYFIVEDTARTAIYYVGSIYDVDGNGVVNWGDLAYAMDYYMYSAEDYDEFYDGAAGYWRMDLDGDGVITMNDYLILMAGIEEALNLQFSMAALNSL